MAGGLDASCVRTGSGSLGAVPSLFDLSRLAVGGGGGGDEETRTPDPLLAKEVLYQLSYVPSAPAGDGGRFWTRTRDLCLIRAVL